MLEALEDRESGRPELPVCEREIELQKRIEQLEKEKEFLEKKMELKDLVHQLELDEAKAKSVKKNVKKKI